jgi:hypothetical protein
LAEQPAEFTGQVVTLDELMRAGTVRTRANGLRSIDLG